MKSEWKTVRLGNVAKINPSLALKKGTVAKKVSMDKITPHCRDIVSYSEEAYSGGAKFVNGCTLMARITPCLENGKISQVRFLDKKEVAFGSTEFIVFDGLEGITDRDFVYYLVNTELVRQKAIDSMVGSSGRQRAQSDEVANIEFPLPPLPIQRKIAAVLGSIDDKIENNRKICANLEAQAQALFKSWFVDFEPFGGKMPQGWKMGKLGDIIESMLNGDWGKDTPDDKNDSPVYCVRGADIPDVVCGNKGKMPLRYILPKNYETKQLANGDVVIEISGGSPTQSTGRAALITDSLLERYDRGMVCTNFCKAVKPRDGFSFLFYNYWCYLYNKGVFFQYENGTTGIKNLDIRTALNELDVVLPGAGALSKFTDIVSSNFKLICKLGLETEKLAATRDALLPKLMSGEIDVEKVKVA